MTMPFARRLSTIRPFGLGALVALVAASVCVAQDEVVFVDDYVDAARAQAASPRLPSLGAPQSRAATPGVGVPVFGRTKIDPRLAPVAYKKPISRPVPQPLDQVASQTAPEKPSSLGGRLSRMGWSNWFSRGEAKSGDESSSMTASAPPSADTVTRALYGRSSADGAGQVVQTSRVTSAPEKRIGASFNQRQVTSRSTTSEKRETAGGALRRWWGSIGSSDDEASEAKQTAPQRKPEQRKVARVAPKTSNAKPKASVGTQPSRKSTAANVARSSTPARQPKPLPSRVVSTAPAPKLPSVSWVDDEVIFVTDDRPATKQLADAKPSATAATVKKSAPTGTQALAAAMSKAKFAPVTPKRVGVASTPKPAVKTTGPTPKPTTKKPVVAKSTKPSPVRIATAPATKPLRTAPLPKASPVLPADPVEPIATSKKQMVVAAPYHEPLDNSERTDESGSAIKVRRLPTATANNSVTQPGALARSDSSERFLPSAESPVVAERNNDKPSERAVEILSKACEDAALAETAEDFSRVVQQCRHVLAIDRATVVVDYAEELGAWALNKRGELRADANLMADAMTDFNEALRMDDQRWRARHNRGVLRAQSGAYAEAFNDFNDVIQQNPQFAKAYSNRASLYVQAGDFDSALSDYRQAISLDPDLAVAHKGRGRVCHMLGQMDEALQHFDAAVLLAPDDAHVASCRADLLVDTARYGQAVAGYRQAIALDPRLATAYRNLAWLEATCPDDRFRDGTSAVSHATTALELTGAEDDVSLDTLAAAHAAAGDFDTAVSLIRRAMSAASGMDASAYAQRLRLYESGQLFLSSPVAPIKQAAYQE